MTVQIIHNSEEAKHMHQNILDMVYFEGAEWKPFRACSATTCKVEWHGKLYTVLRSYNTVVAWEFSGVVYDVLRIVYGYTATSAQHISKFAHDVRAVRIDRYMP